MNPPTHDPRCGTYAGAMAHNMRSETKCGDCRAAAATYARNRRIQRGVGAINYPVEYPRDLEVGLGASLARAWRETA